MDLTRGKQAVRASSVVQSFSRRKRITPSEDAQFWCRTGLDKNGFSKRFINKEIGFGVFAVNDHLQGDFLLEYVGATISTQEADKRNKQYSRTRETIPRCYMYYFRYKGEERCIDATKETQRLAKFVNDAPLKDPRCNAKMKLQVVDGCPRLCLFAVREIKSGDEIRYDYGDNERHLFWRQKATMSDKKTGDGKYKETPEKEESDDDPFDVERDRRQRVLSPEEKQSSSCLNDLSDEVDISDHNDPDYIQESSSGSGDVLSDDVFSSMDGDNMPENSDVSFEVVDELYESDLKEANNVPGKNDISLEHNHNNTLSQSNSNIIPSWTITDLEELFAQTNADDTTPVAKIGPYTLLKSSFYYLKNKLSDEIIDAYMTQVVREKNVLYVDTITATNIFEGRMDKTNLLCNENFQEYNECLAVVNEGGDHWILLIINWTEQKIVYINPLGECQSSLQLYCQRWYDFLDKRSEEGLDKSLPRPWRMMTVHHQKQNDSVSCGIYVLKFAEQYLDQKPLLICGKIDDIRKEVGARLLGLRDVVAEVVHGNKSSENVGWDSNIEQVEESSHRNDVETSTTKGANVCDICQKKFKKRGALTTHIKSHFKTNGSYKKPRRPCPFCATEQTRLSRHIKLKHGDMPDVMQILFMSEKERNKGFEKLRKEGIEIFNKKQAALDDPKYMAERQIGKDDTLVQCSKCKGFYKRNLFYRHKELCIGDDAVVPRKLEISARDVDNYDKEFHSEILSRFQRDDIGNLCRTDRALFIIGRRLFQVKQKKVDKDMEKRKSVMSDMRLLARVYLAFQHYIPESNTLENMYLRENFPSLERAIDDVTKSSDGKLKHGVKYSLYFLLRTSVDYLVGYHNSMKNDEKVNEFEKFIKTLEFHKDIVFGDAIYAIELSRLERLRVPENRILEEDIETLREHTLKVIKRLTCEYTFIGIHEYVLLRDALCSRITLYNARRGGEPSRLKMSNFIEAKNKRWLDNERVEGLQDWEQNLFKEHLITYQPGKGSHLVPVLIPKDCVTGLDLLCCSETRQRANVLKENKYLFPNTGLSADHTSGWNATHRLAKEANVKRLDLVNATKQRHRISTLYCALEIQEEDRQYFYKHMGHSKEVNWGTYQYPLPILEITKVGKHLQDIDKENSGGDYFRWSAMETEMVAHF